MALVGILFAIFSIWSRSVEIPRFKQRSLARDLDQTITQGDIVRFKALYDANPLTRTPSGVTWLQRTAAAGKPEFVAFLLQRGMNPNEGTPRAIESAIGKGNLELVKVLLAHGADINARSSNYTKDTPLLLSIRNKKPEIALFLIDAGADVSIKDEEGSSPLEVARRKGILAEALLVRLQ